MAGLRSVGSAAGVRERCRIQAFLCDVLAAWPSSRLLSLRRRLFERRQTRFDILLVDSLHGKATIYTWKSKYGGMDVSDAQKLKSLEDENRRLKHLVADLSLDKEVLKAVISKNVWSAAGLQPKSSMTKVCVNVSGLFCGQKALATMSMRAHPAS
jgi:Transposase